MLQQNTIRRLEPLRQELAQAQAAFLAAGGTIKEAEPMRAQLTPSQWKDRPRQLPGTRRRQVEKAEQRLVDRIRAFAALGVTGEQIRRRVNLGPVTFEQLVARHGILLPLLRKRA
ncbi:hypothetical protein ACYCFK_17675 [Stutzerimonas stutzeri]